MSVAIVRRTTIIAMLIVNLSGCSYFQSSASDDETDVTEIEDVDKSERMDSGNHEIAKESPPQEAQFELKLKVGDQFPMSKTVEHRLTQTDKGNISVSTSQTDVMLSLAVDSINPDGHKQLTVRYHRVRYMQDIRGKRVFYSSDNPSEPIPPEALLYSGLADNGFSFWISPANKIVETVGFSEFLRGCLRHVPAQYVASVQQQLEATRTEDGIANFIDDSIGLLPFSNDPLHPAVAVKEGTEWDLPARRTDNPFPLLATTKCLLKELNPQSAEILLTGRMSGPPDGSVMRTSDGDLKVFVRGGHCTGTCRVDRTTGLPTRSQVLRYLDLEMVLPDGQRIRQNKETISTINSYLEQPHQTSAGTDRRVQQTGFRNAVGNENHRRVQHAGGVNQD